VSPVLDDDQSASVAENEDENNDDEKRDEIPDAVSNRGNSAFPNHIAVADSVDYGTCRKHHSHTVRNGADPHEYRR